MGLLTRLWREGKLAEENFDLDRLDELLRDPTALVWVDVSSVAGKRADLLGQLARELQFDPHTVEDALAPGERAKATRHQGYNFVTVYATTIGPEPEESFQSPLLLSRISAFVLPNALITVRGDHDFHMKPVVERWDDDPELTKHGVCALLHGLLDVIVDGHFATIQQVDDSIEELEDRLFNDMPQTAEVQRRTYRLRSELVQLRRVILPMRDVVSTLTRAGGHDVQVPHELAGYYDDLYDHVLRASEWTESLRDMITSVFETNLSLQDARLNIVMKKLAGWAAIIAVPTAVTGWFGQNVPYWGFGQHWGVWQSIILIVLGTGLLYWLFRRKDWV